MSFFALLLVSASFVLGADEPAKKPQSPADPLAKVEPRSTPGAGQAYLARFAGEWEVARAIYPTNGGEPRRATGHVSQKMIQDGRFLQSDFVFEQSGRKSTGQGIIGWEPESGLFTSIWIDSRQTRMSMRQSKEKFDGQKIVLISKSLEPDGKETRRSKTISSIDPDGNKIVHRQYSLPSQPGGEERLFMEMVFTRVAVK